MYRIYSVSDSLLEVKDDEIMTAYCEVNDKTHGKASSSD